MNRKHIFLGLLLLVLLYLYVSNIRKYNISIEPLKKYAQNYTPCENDLKARLLKRDTLVFCDQLPIPPDDVVNVLDKRKIDDEYTKWVLIIYLKIFEKQLTLNILSDETRETPFVFKRFGSKSALSRAFCEITGRNYLEKKFGPEFLPAIKAFDFIRDNKLFNNDTEVQRQMKLIDSLLPQFGASMY